MAKCNVPDCKREAGEMGICLGCLTEYRKGKAELRKYLTPGSDKDHHQWPPAKKAADVEGAADKSKTCRVPGCKAPHFCRGICDRHYTALKRKGDTGDEARKYVLPSKTCGSARAKAKAAAPRGPAQVAGVDVLVALVKNQDAGRFSILRDPIRDIITIIDKENDRAYAIKDAVTIKIDVLELK